MGIFLLITIFILAIYGFVSAVRFTHTIILLAPFLLILIFSLGYSQDLKVQRAKPMMGTIVEITVFRDNPFPNRIGEEEIIDLAFQEISRIDKLMSTYKENSQVSLINQQAGIDYVTVGPDVLKVIKMAKVASTLSGGAFDITAAPLVQVWGFHAKKGHMPPEEEIKNRLPLVDYKYILVDQENNRIKLKRPGMAMDLGGIAKGYAVDKAIEILKNNGVHRALVNAGGDLYGLGYPPAKNFWHIGIRHPFIPGKIISTLKIKDQAIATSGNYENFFELNGKRYSHILDPRTGQPIQGVASVTVLAKTAMEADAFATAVAVLGPQKGLELLNSRPDIEGIIILDDHKTPSYLLSQGLEGKLSLAF